MNVNSILGIAAIGGLALFARPQGAPAQCPEEPPLQNYTGTGTVSCPCFVPGEQALYVYAAGLPDPGTPFCTLAGPQRPSWDGRDNDGTRVPSGVYFVKLHALDHTSVRKVLLTK